MEEERRLMYVGVTRAKDQLYLVRAFRRMLYGRGQVNEPSRFLRDAMVAKGVSAERGLDTGGSSWGQPPRAGTSPSHRAGAGLADDNGWSTRGRSSVSGNDSRGQGDRRHLGGGSVSSGIKGWAPGAYSRQPTMSRSDADRVPQFKPGDRVDHGLFGQGIVLKSELTADDEEVSVAFAGKGTKTLMVSFAKLQKLG
jgi:DNA helicase-2/ATP-dependent DNA helicase PcrA